jgi:HSP20 family molecular chaperone IbpA
MRYEWGQCEMSGRDFKNWMWFEAVDSLSRAERLHQQFFMPRQRGRHPTWEPPVDVLETKDEVLVFFALPGVDPEHVEAVIEAGTLVVSGQRVLPEELQTALIHRIELPQGAFMRRIPLPSGRYDSVKRQTINGCLVIRLHKLHTE